MSESFLHYIWLYQYFQKADLFTTEGEPVQIFSTGFHNTNAGPDFLNARIKIGDVQWSGNVEVHINSSAWFMHKHDADPAYENVVLHVVWAQDKDVCRKDGSKLPTLELNDRIDETILFQYKRLINSAESIPCSAYLSEIPDIIRVSALDSMLTIRLQNKANEVLQMLNKNKGDWEETCYQLLARNFGFKVNAEPFMQLARMIPYKLMMKHGDQLIQIEALLFGAAGFLEDDHDEPYYKLLQREFNLLRAKFNLAPRALHKAQWKFLRLRPANFPTLRLAQFASLLFHQRNIFSRLITSASVSDINSVFINSPSAYWQNHYHFKTSESVAVHHVGDSSTENLLINSVAPLFAAYALWRDDLHFMERAVEILNNTPTEANRITRQWATLSVKSKSAFDSQALIELYNNFCSKRRCLDCNIGGYILKPRIQNDIRNSP